MKIQNFVYVMLTLFLAAGLANAADNVDWENYSKKLVTSLKSDNEGVKLSAMQQVITYGRKVNVDDAIHEIVQVYRTHDDVKVRQLALTTIHKTQNAWAMDFLKRNLEHESSPVLKAQIFHILDNYNPGSVYAKRTSESDSLELVSK